MQTPKRSFIFYSQTLREGIETDPTIRLIFWTLVAQNTYAW